MTLPLITTRDPDWERAFARVERRRLVGREEVERATAEIVEDVRQRGDDAVLDAIERYDGYRLPREQLAVDPAELREAGKALAPAERQSLAVAAERVRTFHAAHVPQSWQLEGGGGARGQLGQQVRPIARVGIHVPAAKAPLASTVLMTAVPASVAGVPDLALMTPARQPHPAVLEAVRLAGVHRLYRMGGAHGVAALAFGTQTIKAVDKIVGPGNVWSQAAKRRVFGEVGIDADAGPSEVLIVADRSADPILVAADLLAQAEHEELASVVLVTPDAGLANAVIDALATQLAETPRREICEVSLRDRSLAVVTRDLEQAVELANRYAAEHLQLMVEDPDRWLPSIENAGAIFVGHESTVPLGDYVAGPSHVLPTGGGARFFSPLGVEDFLKRQSVIRLDRDALREVGPHAVRLAELEGLPAHARAVALRLQGLERRTRDEED